MRRAKTKPKAQPREQYQGANPLHYHNGRLYYVKDNALDETVRARIPSQQFDRKPKEDPVE